MKKGQLRPLKHVRIAMLQVASHEERSSLSVAFEFSVGVETAPTIAAFQKKPSTSIAVHRDRVRAFLRNQSGLRIMSPAIALAEYL